MKLFNGVGGLKSRLWLHFFFFCSSVVISLCGLFAGCFASPSHSFVALRHHFDSLGSRFCECSCGRCGSVRSFQVFLWFLLAFFWSLWVSFGLFCVSLQSFWTSLGSFCGCFQSRVSLFNSFECLWCLFFVTFWCLFEFFLKILLHMKLNRHVI